MTDWDMDDNTRRALSEQLDAALFGDVPGGGDVEAVVEQVGRDRLLEAMSGTTDQGTREWKNARDNLSRWRRGARRPNPESQSYDPRAPLRRNAATRSAPPAMPTCGSTPCSRPPRNPGRATRTPT